MKPLDNYSEIERIQIGQRLRQYRESKGFGQSDVSRVCGFYENYMASLERGVKPLVDSRLEALLKLWPRMNADWVLTGRGHPEKPETGIERAWRLANLDFGVAA